MSKYTIPHSDSPSPALHPSLIVEGRNMHVVLQSPQKITLEDRPIPELGPTDILVKVMATGM
jgi:hypothetical protein